MSRPITMLLIALTCLIYTLPTFAQNSGGAICFMAYEDINKNGTHDSDEQAFAGVGVNLVQQELIIGTHITTASQEAFCFRGLTPGTYIVEFEESTNHIAITRNSEELTLSEGQRFRLEYGVLPQSPFLEADEAPTSAGDKVDTTSRLLISLMAAVLAMILMMGFGAVMMRFMY